MSLLDRLSSDTHTLLARPSISASRTNITHTNESNNDTKHLLGFSGGVDSVSLFFILCELNVTFDIAIVHYHTRPQADKEVAYAKELAMRYNKQCFVANAPRFRSNFEHNARLFRFDFFDDVISTGHYDSLILAHQLNDRLEWLLMQLTKGSGLGNMLGFEDRGYRIVRPLESIAKKDLYEYCKLKRLKYFEDKSNTDLSFLRNYFRHHFTNQLIDKYGEGIAKSLAYLSEDYISLLSLLHIKKLRGLNIYAIKKTNNDKNIWLLGCDKCAKKLGYVLSQAQRKEILKAEFNCTLFRILIANNRRFIFVGLDTSKQGEKIKNAKQAKASHNKESVSLYVVSKTFSKIFQQECVKVHIPPRLRYLIKELLALEITKHIKDENPALTYNNIQTNFWKKMRKFFAF